MYLWGKGISPLTPPSINIYFIIIARRFNIKLYICFNEGLMFEQGMFKKGVHVGESIDVGDTDGYKWFC